MLHSDNTKDLCNRITSSDVQTPTDHGFSDSVNSGNFILPNALISNKQSTTNSLCIALPNGCTIASTNTCVVHIVPDLVHSSLISVNQFCDAEWHMEYDITNCYVYLNNQVILQEVRDKWTKTWTMSLLTMWTTTPPFNTKMQSYPSTIADDESNENHLNLLMTQKSKNLANLLMGQWTIFCI